MIFGVGYIGEYLPKFGDHSFLTSTLPRSRSAPSLAHRPEVPYGQSLRFIRCIVGLGRAPHATLQEL